MKKAISILMLFLITINIYSERTQINIDELFTQRKSEQEEVVNLNSEIERLSHDYKWYQEQSEKNRGYAKSSFLIGALLGAAVPVSALFAGGTSYLLENSLYGAGILAAGVGFGLYFNSLGKEYKTMATDSYNLKIRKMAMVDSYKESIRQLENQIDLAKEERREEERQKEEARLREEEKRKQEERRRIAEEEKKKEEERVARIKSTYDERTANAILEGVIFIGMSEAALLESWGLPDDINTTINKYGTSKQFVYPFGDYVYTEDGIITTIQQ